MTKDVHIRPYQSHDVNAIFVRTGTLARLSIFDGQERPSCWQRLVKCYLPLT